MKKIFENTLTILFGVIFAMIIAMVIPIIIVLFAKYVVFLTFYFMS